LKQEAIGWRPQEGDGLVGVIEGLVPTQGPYGQGHKLLVRTELGLYQLWLTGYLKGQLDSYKAAPGDGIGIAYQGKGVSRLGKPFNRYEVVVQRRNEQLKD
jgi:hypothetical protein